jgi:hypothetical protein
LDNHALLSSAYDTAEGLALSRRNPWQKLSPQDAVDTKIEIYKSLRRMYSQSFEQSQKAARTVVLKVSATQYLAYAIGFSVWHFVANSDPSILWSIFLFLAPVLSLLMNYFLLPLSTAVRNHRSLVKDLDQVVGLGYDHFVSSLEGLKYSSSPSDTAPKPNADLKVLGPQEAEEFCAAWLRSLGFLDAQVTRFSRDGGIDVESQRLCAQVKHQVAPVGVKAIRELFGVAVQEEKAPVFFALSDYTSEAKMFATKVGMPIIKYSSNSLIPLNQPAELLISQGPRFVQSSAK